jgi:DNA-binding YbaB/EbfC family protein
VFKGLGNLANVGAILKQAQEMSGRMQALQDELRAKKATGVSGGGLIEVDVNGLSEVLAVRIDPGLVERGEREMIEDLLPAAIRAAQQKAREMHAAGMQSLTTGANLPGLQEALAQFTGGPGGEKS